MKDLWKSRPGFATHDWALFRQSLEEAYPARGFQNCHSKQQLHDLVKKTSQYRMRDEDDVLEYYRRFFFIATPLVDSLDITTKDQDYAFWYGFHADDRRLMSNRLDVKFPDRALTQAYPWEDVLKVARTILSGPEPPPLSLWEEPHDFHERPPRDFNDLWDSRDPRESGRERQPYERNRERESYHCISKMSKQLIST
jgi:hypothetical protein